MIKKILISIVLLVAIIGFTTTSVSYDEEIFSDEKVATMTMSFLEISDIFISRAQANCLGPICIFNLSEKELYLPYKYYISVMTQRSTGFVYLVFTKEEKLLENETIEIRMEGIKFNKVLQKYEYEEKHIRMYKNENHREEKIERKDIWNKIFDILIENKEM
jgi:hypothetical protein